MKALSFVLLVPALVCLALTPLGALLSCTPANSPSPDVFSFTGEQVDCSEQADSRPAADACRAAALASFCHEYPNAKVCASDAGADR